MGTYENHKKIGVCNKSEDENNFMKIKFQIFPQKHDNRIRYKFFNLEHLLLYINNIQIQLNINTQKLQSFLIIRKTTKNNNMKCRINNPTTLYNTY
jgi:hypothetical protein